MTIIIKDSGVLSWKVSGVFLGALRILFPLVEVLLLSKFQKRVSLKKLYSECRKNTSQCIYAYVESTVRGGGAGAQCGPRWRQTGVSSLQHCSTAAAAATRSPAATTTTHEQSTAHLIILTFSFKKYKYWLA